VPGDEQIGQQPMTEKPETDQRVRSTLLRLVRTLPTEESARPATENDRRSLPGLEKHALYQQVCEFLARRISSGAWRPGAVLPNELELAREQGVSPGTMRKALDKLEADQIVVRRQGKGTLVVDHTEKVLAARFGNFVNAQGRRIAATDATIVACEVGRATEIEQTHLDVQDDEKVMRTRRVYAHQGRPYLYEETCLAIDRLGLRAGDVAGDYLIAPLAHRCGMRLARAVEKVTVAEPSPKVVELLALPPGSTPLTLHRLVLSLDDQPVEWRMAVCNLRDESYMVEMI
jgi:GntR family transcriptional regulator